MKILHYFLGFPPYRTGGLTKYATDLMSSQAKEGHEVVALWPGSIISYNASPIIKKRKAVGSIENYELVNPLPVSLDEGIWDIDAYTKSCDGTGYRAFLEKLRPDVVHIHTLMGLHKEFVEIAHSLNIKTVMTSHDYFGLCPKVTMFRFGKCCDNDHGCRDCIQCNLSALSLRKIQLIQSPIYRQLKNTWVVKKLRKHHRGAFFQELQMPEMPECDIEEVAAGYRKLREYYLGIYRVIDTIHFNSTLTEEIYNRFFTPRNSKVISISHSEIRDNRKIKHSINDKFRIFCLAPAKSFKGFEILREALNQLWETEKNSFELYVFSPVNKAMPYMHVQEEGYAYEEFPMLMRNADLVVAPSIWYETFGFTVLEALSYGVPVVVSDHMGAKDIVGQSGIIVETGNVEQLKNAILKMMKTDSYREAARHSEIVLWTDVVNSTMDIYEN